MKILVLKDSEWARGRHSYLCMPDHDDPATAPKCCLGIALCALGVDARGLVRVCLPSDLTRTEAEALFDEDTPLSTPLTKEAREFIAQGKIERKEEDEPYFSSFLEDTIANINDDNTLDDAERVEELRPLFKELGFDIVFDPDN